MRYHLLALAFFVLAIVDTASSQHGLINGDMEGWRRRQFRCCGRNVDLPVEWGIPEQSCGLNFNKFVFLEENPLYVHSGRFSAVMSSDTSFFNDIVLQPGMLVYGGYQDASDSAIRIGQPVPQYGLPIDSNPVKLDFWLMMSHDLADTFSYMYLFTRWDSQAHRVDTLAFSTRDVPDTDVRSDEWFEIKDSIRYLMPGQADTVKIIFYGGRFGNPALAGNATWIDDIRLLYAGEDTATSAPAAMQQTPESRYKLMPNPASDILHITADASVGGVHFSMSDALGRKVLDADLNERRDIDISQLSTGTYICHLTDSDGQNIFQQRLVIAR